MRKTFFAFATAGLLMLVGCTTYQAPAATPASDPTLVGMYEARYSDDGIATVHEYVLFPDGYFQETIVYADEDEPYYDFGVYRFLADESSIEFFFIDADSRDYNFVGLRDVGGDTFSDGLNDFARTGSQEDVSALTASDLSVAGTYLLTYESDGEDVYYIMTLDSDGTFVEWSVYPDDVELFSDSGRYDRASGSGITQFSYDDWPEGNFVGRVDGSTLNSIEGRYVALDPDGDAALDDLPPLVRSLLSQQAE